MKKQLLMYCYVPESIQGSYIIFGTVTDAFYMSAQRYWHPLIKATGGQLVYACQW